MPNNFNNRPQKINMENNQLAVIPPQINNTQLAISPFGSLEGFELSQRMSKALSHSLLVPESYRGEGNLGNCLIAQDIASRTGFGILAVMQNLHIIEGRPAWSAPFIIGAVAASRRFSSLRFRITQKGKKRVEYEYWTGSKQAGTRQKKTSSIEIEDRECVAWALDLSADGNREPVEGPAVSLSMAIMEGWYMRNGSKWKTMPDVMLHYRAAAFFGRLYVPEILMGMKTDEEIYDIETEVLPPIKDGGEIFPTSETETKTLPAAQPLQPAQPIHRGRGRPPKAAVAANAAPVQETPEITAHPPGYVEAVQTLIPRTKDPEPVEVDAEPEPEPVVTEPEPPAATANEGELDPDIF